MAVEKNGKENKAARTPFLRFKGRQFWVGANVILVTAMALVIVILIQWWAFKNPAKGDWTGGGVNSLTDGTKNLLHSLDQPIRLTSMYFQTDLESEDQPKFRDAITDVVQLFQSENRSKIETDYINPLQDHEKRERMIKRLADIPEFQDEIKEHREIIDYFIQTLMPDIKSFIDTQMVELGGMIGPDQSQAGSELGQIRHVLDTWERRLSDTVKDVDVLVQASPPRYADAVRQLGDILGGLQKDLSGVAEFCRKRVAKPAGLASAGLSYMQSAKASYDPIIAKIEMQVTKTREVPPVKLDELLRKLQDSNAVLVESEDDARVLGFEEMWPPKDPSRVMSGRGFDQRKFAGETMLSSAIVQLTTDEKPAAIFVRYGGPPLFSMGFMPNQPRGMFDGLKMRLERLNFSVHDWDVKTAPTPPRIDPPPSKKLLVVLRPEPPQPDPRTGMPSQGGFTPAQAKAVTDAVREAGRAIFLAGWMPPSFTPMGSPPYEYVEYLKNEWGLKLDTDVLTLVGIPRPGRPGEWAFGRMPFLIDSQDLKFSDNLIVKNIRSLPGSFPFVVPVREEETLPEGVKIDPLITLPAAEKLWGVSNVQQYFEEAVTRGYVTKQETDVTGPFNIAVTAEKGDAKIVVFSCRGLASDEIAQRQGFVATPAGFALVLANPMNYPLFLNCMHWLNDNEEWIDLGTEIDVSRLDIDEGALKFWKVALFAIWPAVVLACGGAMYLIRRR